MSPRKPYTPPAIVEDLAVAPAIADVVVLLSEAEIMVGKALRAVPSCGDDKVGTIATEVAREALALARSLVTETKTMLTGGVVNKLGFVQGRGSRVDVLCAELAIRLEQKPTVKVAAVGQ